MLTSNHKKIKKYCRIHDKNISPFLNNIFLDQHIIKTNSKDECDLFIPRNQEELTSMNLSNNTIIGTIDNINQLNKKNKLWNNLVDTWGRNIASQIIPPTFNILQKQELRRFAANYLNTKGTYILKNEQESARGILVSNNLKDMTNHILEKKTMGYPITVIQKIIKSLLINDHVFKMRMFLLIKCDKDTRTKHFYLHNLGGLFYAPQKYSNSLNNENIIANGYWYNFIEKTDYISFINDKPKNLRQLWKYLEKLGINKEKMMEKINNLLILIFKSIQDKIYTKQYSNDQFCILGFDVMIDSNFKPWIIEFNKGPSTKDYEDMNVSRSKRKVWNDIYNLIEDKPNDFIEIYTY